ncbi:MAG: hypothetical protein ACR2G2_07395 [Pseudonocardia sp.]
MTNNGSRGQDDDHNGVGGLRPREIRDIWREVCEAAPPPLSQWIPMPDSVTIAYPKIDEVIMGNPRTIMVWLRPGQIPSDVEAYAPRIAYAMGAAEVRVYETDTRRLLRIELLSRRQERFDQDIPRLPRPQTDPFPGEPFEGPDDGEAA